MDFINQARSGSANKEQGEKSCIVSHNNFIFIDNFNPLKPLSWLTVTSNESKKNGENNTQIKIFKTNATAIQIKCSNNFPRQYSVEITYTNLE